MSEPRNQATKIVRLTSDIFHWSVEDDRIKFRSEAYAIRPEGARSVLIDPLPLEEKLLDRLGKVEAICLTGACHQRATWRYRKQFGARVFAPRGAAKLLEAPDVWYGPGEDLPGGLKAVHAPGPTDAFYVFLRPAGAGTLFCSDVLIHDGKSLVFVPDEHLQDPRRTRETARAFLDLRFGLLCFSHGAPLFADPHAAVRSALERDAAGRS